MTRLSRKSRTKITKAAIGLVVSAGFCLTSLPSALADYLSNRTPEVFYAKTPTPPDFSDWTPRKGKMTYERDNLQPEWGLGRYKKRYELPCKRLARHVGPKGKAEPGDIIVVVSDGECEINRLAIHKPVKIITKDAAVWEANSRIEAKGPNGPVFNWLKGIDGALQMHGDQFKVKIRCPSVTFPCITVNVRNEGTATIEGFHIKANNRLLAPLVESRSGGIVLRNNFIEGEARPLKRGSRRLEGENQRQFGDDRATAVLIHGSMAILENNTISGARTGVALLPSQRSIRGSRYELSRNRILNMELEAVHADGMIFMGERPRVKVSLIGNMIYSPAIGYFARNVESQLIHNNFNPAWIPKFHSPYNPEHDIYKVDNHIAILGGSAAIQSNVFRAARWESIQIMEGAAAYVDNNVFGSNKKIFYGLRFALAERSSFPSGNLCRNQPFESQYTGAPGVQYRINVNTGAISTHEMDTKKAKRRRSSEKELWDAYQGYIDGVAEQAEQKAEDRTGDTRKKRRRSKKARYMWPAFENYFHRSQRPIFSHAMYGRPDVDPADLYFACVDYSTMYRQTIVGDGSADPDRIFGQ